MRVTCGPDPDLGDTVTFARPEGKLDAHGASRLWEVVADRIDSDSPDLLIDMEGVDYMSSAGVGILIRLLRRTRGSDGTVILFGCNDNVKKVIRICELEDVLSISDNAAEARQRMG